MKKLSKILMAALALVMCAAFVGCAPADSAPAETPSAPADSAPAETPSAPADSAPADTPAEQNAVDRIKAAGKLTMLTEATFPPFEYLGDNNEIAGVDVDIAQAIADELGVELEVDNMDFDGIVPSIMGGKGDLGLAGITADDERRQSVDFSDNYVDATLVIITSKDNDEFKEEDDAEALAAKLNGKSVGVQLGTTSDLLVTDSIEGVNVKRYKSFLDAALDLAGGRLDAMVCDNLPAQQIVATNDNLKIIEEPLSIEQYAIAIKKNSPELVEVVNKVLKDLTDAGKIEESMQKHVEATKVV